LPTPVVGGVSTQFFFHYLCLFSFLFFFKLKEFQLRRLLKKLDIDLPFDPAIPLLGIYPKDCDTGYSRGTCTPMFIAALFTIAKLWKQPRCPTIDKWIKKMWYLVGGKGGGGGRGEK
jgi:hypothetical protein